MVYENNLKTTVFLYRLQIKYRIRLIFLNEKIIIVIMYLKLVLCYKITINIVIFL